MTGCRVANGGGGRGSRRALPLASASRICCLTQLAFPIITAAIGGVLGNVGEDQGRLWIRRRARRRATTAGVKAADPRAGKSGERPAHDMLTSDEVRALHDACERDARAVGISAAKATLLADAFLGALSSRLGRD